MRRRALVAMLAMTVAGGMAGPAGLQAQSNLSVTYTPIKTTPTADDFVQGFVVIGKFDMTITVCDKPNCFVRMWATSQPSGQLRVRVSAATPTTATQCATVVPTQSSSSLFVANATTFPTTFSVWVCYPLSWTGASSAPNAFLPSQFVFQLTQSNSAGS